MPLIVKLLTKTARKPICASPGSDLGFDVFADEDRTIWPFRVYKVRTGIAAKYQARGEFGLIVKDRGSMAAQGFFTSAGVVDAGYTGEILILLGIRGLLPRKIHKGQKIAQLLPIPVSTLFGSEVADTLPQSARGVLGFGSTGK